MRKPEVPSATDEETHIFDPSSHSSSRSHVRPEHDHGPTTRMPGWVKVLIVIFIVLALMFVIMHLTGNGFGNHMSMSVIKYGMPQL